MDQVGLDRFNIFKVANRSGSTYYLLNFAPIRPSPVGHPPARPPARPKLHAPSTSAGPAPDCLGTKTPSLPSGAQGDSRSGISSSFWWVQLVTERTYKAQGKGKTRTTTRQASTQGTRKHRRGDDGNKPMSPSCPSFFATKGPKE